MTSTPNADDKRDALFASATFNSRSQKVQHPVFSDSKFFDPEDLVQLKYETLRALGSPTYSIAQASKDFGLSRPTIYQAQAQFAQFGLQGLLPRKPGPKKPRKLTTEIREHLEQWRESQPHLNAAELAARLSRQFKLKVHPRTIEKALKTKPKKGLRKQ